MEETFKNLVGAVMEGKLVSPSAEGYVVEVLCTFVSAPHADPCALHLNDLLRRGLNAEGLIRREYLKVTGDLALFMSGIFPDRLETLTRKTAYDLGYLIDIGRSAYDNIQSELFEELADNFPQIVGALNDVSISVSLTRLDLICYLNRRKQIDARIASRQNNPN